MKTRLIHLENMYKKIIIRILTHILCNFSLKITAHETRK